MSQKTEPKTPSPLQLPLSEKIRERCDKICDLDGLKSTELAKIALLEKLARREMELNIDNK